MKEIPFDELRGKPPVKLPDDFAARTTEKAVLARKTRLAMRVFQVGSCLAILFAGSIGWMLSLTPSEDSAAPPALSLFHASKSPRLIIDR